MSSIPYIKLSDLTRQIETSIRQYFGGELYWIIAEISSHKFYPNQDRHYFEFVEKAAGSADPVAKIRGVSWRNSSQTIKQFEKSTGQRFTDGVQVLVQVKLEFHQTYGLSLSLVDIDQSFTLGNLEKQRREILLRLVAENPGFVEKVGEDFLTYNKQIRLSPVIQKLAIIGSANSEGYTDFTHTLLDNQFNYKFTIDVYLSSVQGAAAEKELVKKMIAVFESGKEYDCVVIIRGGGSKTDFLVFDTYDLSKAVAKFPIPVLTGIGHHKDVSIVDLMAHTSMKTPTKAAEFILAHNRNFEEAILVLQKNLIIKSQQLIAHHLQVIQASNMILVNQTRVLLNNYKEDLHHSNNIIINKTKTMIYEEKTDLVSLLNQFVARPRLLIATKSAALNNASSNLKYLSKQLLSRQEASLNHYHSLIQLMDPVNLLKKGFAMILKDNKILKDSKSILGEDELTIVMHDSQIKTNVISKIQTDGKK